jgi:SET domain-containing protein
MCTADIEPGEVIGIARVGLKRTPLGRYINHSANPNATGRYANGNIEVIATRHIRGDGSLLCDGEEITVCYRESVKLSKVMPCQVG